MRLKVKELRRDLKMAKNRVNYLERHEKFLLKTEGVTLDIDTSKVLNEVPRVQNVHRSIMSAVQDNAFHFRCLESGSCDTSEVYVQMRYEVFVNFWYLKQSLYLLL